MDVIEVDDVSKNFRHKGKDFFALKDVSFSVEKGEIFGLLGPNGAGKTTMLNIPLSILTQDSGTVRVFGKPVGPEVLERMNLVSSDTRFHWVLPCREILEFYGRVYGLNPKERARRADKLAKLFGIEDIMGRRYSYLSTGEKVRLNFVKALLNEPDLLLLDEPTLGLDPDIAIKVRSEIKRISKKFGTTILLTSHYMHEVEQLADRIAFIDKGEIIDTGFVEKILVMDGSYEAVIKVAAVKAAGKLRRHGFRISGNVLRKKLRTDANVSEPLAFLAKLGIIVNDVETKRPTLEDYFVKMASNKISENGKKGAER